MARRMFPGQDPLGKRITLSDPRGNPVWLTIVGVVHDMKQNRWIEAPSNEVHIPFLQNRQFMSGKDSWTASMTLIARTVDRRGFTATGTVKSAIWSVDHNLPLSAGSRRSTTRSATQLGNRDFH